MKIALTLSALALSIAPAFAGGGCHSDQMKGETASTCVPGYTWDAVKAACTATPSS